MKKIFALLIPVFFFSACAVAGNPLSPPTSVPSSTPTNTPTPAPTLTPTVPSPTFTSTPTPIRLDTKTPVPAADTPTPLVLTLTMPGVTLLPTYTPVALVPQVPIPGFVSVSASDEVFYKGSKCEPSSVKFTAQVSDAANAAFVVLFVRFKSKQSGVTSEWTSITMETNGIGTFTHELFPLEMKAVDGFENAWVQYQLVATDSNSKQIGRTGIFDERLSLLNCVPTPTAAPSATPTVLMP
ncbi:MAG: hypothetical protein LDL51_05575 [Chloroflexi bacterium]|nr:hypothetical protein [Chloroflexota bacterium]